jgi:O-antigen ligase
MADTALRHRGSDVSVFPWLLAVSGVVLAVAASYVMGPDGILSAIIAGVGIIVIATRPHWGVATIMVFLMVQYGSRRYERAGLAGTLESLIPGGSGLLTLNNVVGMLLLVVLVYHVYRDGDWSFLHNRQLQLVTLLTLALLASGAWNQVDYREQAELGLRIRGQDPMRLMFSRGLFLLLFVCFVRRPREIRLIAGIFVILALMTAWSGSSVAILGGGREEVAAYRAGGTAVLLEAAQNPNRLAMFATLGLIFIWQYIERNPGVRYRGFAFAGALLMVVTVFLSASRGGIVGLGVASALMFVRRRQGMKNLVYGAAAALVAAMLVGQLLPPEALERITNIPGLSSAESGEGTGSVERRQYTLGVGVKLWAEAPVLGVGLGNWSYRRFLSDPARSTASPHNAYVKALAEGGIVTLFLYLALFYVTIRQLNTIVAHPGAMAWARSDGIDWLVHATRISLMTFLVFSLFADLFDLIFFYLLIGLAAALIRRYFSGEVQPLPATAV